MAPRLSPEPISVSRQSLEPATVISLYVKEPPDTRWYQEALWGQGMLYLGGPQATWEPGPGGR